MRLRKKNPFEALLSTQQNYKQVTERDQPELTNKKDVVCYHENAKLYVLSATRRKTE